MVIMDRNINWLSTESQLILNSKLDDQVQQRIIDIKKPDLPGHLWLLTSGTMGATKLVALSKQAFLNSAVSVNQHLEVSSKDKWLNVLPLHHVGGLSIFARAHLSESLVVNQPQWVAKIFKQNIEKQNLSLSALVPTQVYDLVKNNLTAPKSIRAIVVGGAVLPVNLYIKARSLGWPLLPSYGLTEAGSQVATAALSSLDQETGVETEMEPLKIMPHLQLRTNSEQVLEVSGSSLLTGFINIEDKNPQLIDPLQQNWLRTQDRVELSQGELRFISRADQQIKINGELVQFNLLQKKLEFLLVENNCLHEMTLFPIKDERAGSFIALFCSRQVYTHCKTVVSQFNSTALPYERIRCVYMLKQLPKTDLGKIKNLSAFL